MNREISLFSLFLSVIAISFFVPGGDARADDNLPFSPPAFSIDTDGKRGEELTGNELKTLIDDIRSTRNARDIVGAISLGSLIWGVALIAPFMSMSKMGIGCGGHNECSDNLTLGIYAILLNGALVIGTGVASFALHMGVEGQMHKLPKGFIVDLPNESLGSVKWIDRPGNKLKLSSYILAGLSVAPVTLTCLQNAKVLSAHGDAFIWAPFAGFVMGVTAAGLFAGGVAMGRNAAYERRFGELSMVPFVSPGVEGGASIGVAGTF